MRRILPLFCVMVLAGCAGWAMAAEPVREDAQDVAPPDTAALLREIRDLRADVLRLQQTVDALTEGELVQLRAENERLRKEVHELSGMNGQTLPSVPMPDRALLEGLYPSKKAKAASASSPPEAKEDPGAAPPEEKDANSGAESPSETTPAADDANPAAEPPPPADKDAAGAQETAVEAPAAPQPFKFDIVEEWGRSPDEVAAANRKAASLKGVIGVVPEGSSDEDLANLGRSLREQYAAFDNVNIEVFDNITAARAYKGKYIAPPKHRVLSISKHKASNRDVILLIRDEKAVTVPLEPPAAQQ